MVELRQIKSDKDRKIIRSSKGFWNIIFFKEMIPMGEKAEKKLDEVSKIFGSFCHFCSIKIILIQIFHKKLKSGA